MFTDVTHRIRSFLVTIRIYTEIPTRTRIIPSASTRKTSRPSRNSANEFGVDRRFDNEDDM